MVWSSTFRTAIFVRRVVSRWRISISLGMVFYESFRSVVSISPLEVSASRPLCGLVTRSPFFALISGECNYFFQRPIRFQFVPVLHHLATPTWSVTIRTAIKAKSFSVLSSFLICVYWSRVSLYSINSMLMFFRS